MSTYSRLRDLPVSIDEQSYVRLERDTSSGFVRVSTEIHLHGGGITGRGEDVWTNAADHDAYPDRIPDIRGTWTVHELCRRLHDDDLFPAAEDPNGPRFRRWGFQSAALDLALRQAGMSLAEALGRTPRPVRFVQSVRLGEPSTIAPLAERVALDPNAQFKLDPVNDWDEALVAQIVALGRERVVAFDFKGRYHGTPVDTCPDPALYELCIREFPHAWLEDPHDDPSIDAVLEPSRDRVTWDAPLHTLTDITSLPHTPREINIKPCRFGDLATLTEVYDYCERHGIGMYGGGFFELGVGRGQIQYLASLFHPDGPNDVAPRGYHHPSPPPGLPTSPLAPPDPTVAGFHLEDADPATTG